MGPRSFGGKGGVMGKYTPGPWWVDESHINGSINAGKRHVAMANFYNCHDEEVRVTRDQQKANAQLISAAPDLLEALKKAVDALERADDSGMPGLRKIIFEADAAIGKAEGE